eukprot:gene2916-3350_t
MISSATGLGYVPLSGSREKGFICSDKPIKDAKFSPNSIYAATQFNDTDIEILNRTDGRRIVQTTKYKSTKGTVILGFYFVWAKGDSLVIITNTSIELYQITSNMDTILCKPTRDVKLKIASFVFSSRTCIILTYAGTGNTIQPYKLSLSYIERLPKFPILDSVVPLDLTNLYITTLYNKIYCIYGDQRQITFYELTLETVYKSQVIKLLLPGANHIHFVDNIIIVHHHENKISMVYDLKMLKEPSNFPISAIPMVFQDQAAFSGAQLYLPSWRYISPNHIFDSASGRWYEVTLNFEKISNFFQVDNANKIIPFLQQRSSQNAKMALLAHIRNILEYKSESLEGLGKIFDSLNHDLFSMTGKNNTAMLHQHLAQKKLNSSTGGSNDSSPVKNDDDGHHQRFSPSNPTRQTTMNISSSRSLGNSTGGLKTSMDGLESGFSGLNSSGGSNGAMAPKLNVRGPSNVIVNSEDLYEYVFNPIYDKIVEDIHDVKADQSMAEEERACQLLRLEMDSKYLIAIVTEQVLLALRFMRSTKAKCEPELFLRHASTQNDDTLFFSVYKFFESTNQLNDSCERYIKLFKEKFTS